MTIINDYIVNGWSLVPVLPGTKGPSVPGWNLKENTVRDAAHMPPGYNVGLAHAYSGTMALDIDQWERADTELQKHGISLQSLYTAPDSVVISSGKPGHGKLLYKMPFGAALPSKKLSDGGITYLEFRCATVRGFTVQDILPPSVHPETQRPYEWAGNGHWTRLPTIPAPLLALWNSLLSQDAERSIVSGGAVNASWDEIKQAVGAIPADCSREEWISVGMALHWAGTQSDQIEQAMQLWNDWSASAPEKYNGEREITTQWASFRQEKSVERKLGTLFHIAKKYGWQRPLPDAQELFSKIETPAMAPLDILDGLRPKAPIMSLDPWPAVIRKRAEEVSDGVGCDPIIPLFSGLSAVCAVVDARTRLELMPGFQVPPVLWLMTIGAPADKKTPGSKPMLSVLRDIEAEDRPRYTQEVLQWEGKEAAYSSAKKAFLEWSASPEALLGDDAPHVPDMPPKPVPLKFTVSDVTSQKLVRIGADRPRGVLCYLDEMNSWIAKITNKQSGEDRSAWVVSYEASAYEMDRVGAGAIHADNLAVSMYCNVQPTVLRQNLPAMACDGLLQRFVPGILHGSNTRLGNPVPESLTSASTWENTLRMIYALPVQTYRLSPQAYEAFRSFQRWYEEAKRDERLLDSGDVYMTAFGKLEGLAGRFILLFHIIERPFSPEVSVDIVERVVSLVRGYIIPAYRYALGEVGGAITNDFDQWVIDHIVHISEDVQIVTLSGLKRSARRHLEGKTDWQKNQAVLDAMLLLEQSNWVVQIESELHKQKVTWAINPSLHEMFKSYRQSVIKAKQRHADYIYRYAYDKGASRKFVKGYTTDMDEEEGTPMDNQ